MKNQKRQKLGRPHVPGYRRGRAFCFYIKPDLEAKLRTRAEAKDKSLSAVVTEAIEQVITEEGRS